MGGGPLGAPVTVASMRCICVESMTVDREGFTGCSLPAEALGPAQSLFSQLPVQFGFGEQPVHGDGNLLPISGVDQ